MGLERPITPRRVMTASLVLLLVLLLVIGLALSMGTADVSLTRVLRILLGLDSEGDTARLIVLKIRLPRILLAGLVGFSLSLGGVIFQAILRNPLADPFI